MQLVEALNAMMPSGFSATFADGFVHIKSSTNCVASAVRMLIEQDGEPREHLFTAAYNVFNNARM
jgi:hypothetical protein